MMTPDQIIRFVDAFRTEFRRERRHNQTQIKALMKVWRLNG